MNEDELEGLWSKLKLTEEEEVGVTVGEEDLFEEMLWSPNCLLGSVLTKKSLNAEAFKGTMGLVWKSTPLIRNLEVGDNLFLFQFRSCEEREIVINGGPWHFDNRLILLKKLEKEDRPGKDLFTKASFWVQIYGLPFMSMTEKMGFLLGKKIGTVSAVRTDEEGVGLGPFLAIRVEIDIRNLLHRRIKVASKGREDIWVELKYVRLLHFYFYCGILGHNDVDCTLAIKKRRDEGKCILQYGSWLKAPERYKGNKGSGYGGRAEGRFQNRKPEEHGGEKTNATTDGGGGSPRMLGVGEGKVVISDNNKLGPTQKKTGNFPPLF